MAHVGSREAPFFLILIHSCRQLVGSCAGGEQELRKEEQRSG